LPPGALGRLGSLPLHQSSRATCCAYAPDGFTFATGEQGGRIIIWDATTGRPIKTLGGPEGEVGCLAYTSDGRRLISLAAYSKIHIWDVASGQEVRTFDITMSPSCIALLPDGKTLATAMDKVFLFDLETGESKGELVAVRPTTRPQPFGVGSWVTNATKVVVSGDGKVLVEGQDNGWIYLWDLATRRQIGSIPASARGWFGIAISPDGRTLAASNAKAVLLYDLAAQREIGKLATRAGVMTGLTFSHDGTLLGGMGSDGLARVWDLTNRQEKWNVRTGQDDRGLSYGGANQWGAMAFSPDDKRVLMARRDTTVGLYDAKSGEPIFDIHGHTDEVECLAFSPDGCWLYSGSSGGSPPGGDTVRKWDLAKRKEAWIRQVPAGAIEMTLSADGLYLALHGPYEPVRVISAADGNDMKVIPWQKAGDKERDYVRSLSPFSPDGQTLTVAIDGSGVKRWWWKENRVEAVFRDFGDSATAICASRDGKFVAVAGPNGVDGEPAAKVEIYDLGRAGSRKMMGDPLGCPVEFFQLQFSPDNRVLATVSYFSGICFWDPLTGRLLAKAQGDTNDWPKVVFTPDSRLLATREDGAVRLIRVSDGSEAGRLQTGPVQCIAISPDGTTLASTGWDGTILLWDLRPIVSGFRVRDFG